jgi:hypothetical protein
LAHYTPCQPLEQNETIAALKSATPILTMGSMVDSLPYWQVNVPEAERTYDCPDFLQNLSKKDLGIISTPDRDFTKLSWPTVQKLISDNRIDLFQRIPSELRRYLAFNWKLKQDYGSVMNFVLSQRLQWTLPILPKGNPFEFADDIKILWNDWPYGIDERIVHLVIWTKFDLEDDPATDDLTATARAEIDRYVDQTFGTMLPKYQVSSIRAG